MAARLTWTSGVSEQVRLNRYRIYRAEVVNPQPEDFTHLIDFEITYTWDGELESETLEYLDSTAVSGTTYTYYVVFDDDDDRNRPFSAQSNMVTIVEDFIPPGPPTLEGSLVPFTGTDTPDIYAGPGEGGFESDPLFWEEADFGDGHTVAFYDIYAGSSYPATDFGGSITIDELTLVGTVAGDVLTFGDWPSGLITTMTNGQQQTFAAIVVARNDIETLTSDAFGAGLNFP